MNGITKLVVIAGIIIAIGIIMNVTGLFFSGRGANIDYDYKAERNLDKQDLKGDEVISFKLDSQKDVRINWTSNDINAKKIDLMLTGPNGYSKQLLHGEEFWSNNYSESYKEKLDKGEYKLVLNCTKSKGLIVFKVKVE